MTTKTIPVYLEDERRKRAGDRLRIDQEAARIQPLQHGHHRTSKQPDLELLLSAGAEAKARKTAKTTPKKSRASRNTTPKTRKVA
jgi:hypothetical protein